MTRPHVPRSFALKCLLDDFQRLLFRRFKEPAGVHDDHIRGRFVADGYESVGREHAEHALRVHEVLRTSKTDKRY
jgi:hypothetical protein